MNVRRILAAMVVVGAAGACVDEELDVGSTEQEIGTYRSNLRIVETHPLINLVDGEDIHHTRAKIVRRPDGITVKRVKVRNLTPGNAVVLVTVTFNNSEECTVGNPVTGAPCGPADLANPAVDATLQHLGGGVLDSHGRLDLYDDVTFAVGDTSRCFVPGPPCRTGVQNPMGSEFHVVVRDKGPAATDPVELQEQITQFGAVGSLAAGAQFIYDEIPEPRGHTVIREWTDVKSLVDGTSFSSSIAKIKRTEEGISVRRFQVRGLTPGNAYVLLTATFNDSEACTIGNPVTGAPCGPADVPNNDVEASLQYLSGGVVDSHGRIRFKHNTMFAVGDLSRCFSPGPPCRNGITNPLGSEFHIVVRDKGPASSDPAELEEQITQFGAGTLAAGAQFIYDEIPEP